MAAPEAATIDRATALAALRWWVDAGVDVVCADTPSSWLRQAPTRAPNIEPPAPAEPTARAPRPARPSEPTSEHNADMLARAADRPAALAQAARAFAGEHALLYDGPPENGLLFIIDVPTHEDTQARQLISGDPGRLLDRMLAAIGLTRGTVAVATAMLHTGGEAREMAFLHRLIALTRPRVLVALGGPAAARLIDDTRGLNRLRGRWFQTSIENEMFPVLPTFHPAHLTLNPHHKALAWADLLTLKASLAR